MDEIEKFYIAEKKNLTSFIYRMTNNLVDTEDILHDTLLTALEKKEQFKGNSNFKTWIFSIASNKTIDFLRKEKRWTENIMDKAKAAAINHPEFMQLLLNTTQQSSYGKFEVKEHIELCFRCIGKTLSIEQQLALILKDIFDFRVKEIAQILDKTASQVKHYLEDARGKMIEIYDRRCALINRKGICHQCSELNGIFNPKQDIQQKLMEIKFARDAASKSKEKLYALRNDLVKSIDPLHSEGHEFQDMHMTFICQVAKENK